VGIDPHTAAILATEHEFSWIQRQVAKWWTQVQAGKSTGPGGLIHRLNKRWGPGPFPEKFKTTDLYSRHWHQPTPQEESNPWADFTT
jgi:hypothetical protein